MKPQTDTELQAEVVRLLVQVTELQLENRRLRGINAIMANVVRGYMVNAIEVIDQLSEEDAGE